MREIQHLLSIKEMIESNVRSGAHFRHLFMGSYNKKFGSFPKVNDIFDEEGWIGCIINDNDNDVVVSLCDDTPVLINSLFSNPVEIENISFNVKYHIVNDIIGDKVIAFVSPSGKLRGKIGSNYFFDSSILDEVGIADNIRNLCNDYKCIVFGYIVDRKFIATEISDLGNNSVYIKDIADKIFDSYGIEYQSKINSWAINSALNEYGAVIIKIYHEGQLYRYIKKSNFGDMRNIQSQINNLLINNLERVSYLDIDGIYDFVISQGNYSQHGKLLLMKAIKSWKETIDKLTAKELYELFK